MQRNIAKKRQTAPGSYKTPYALRRAHALSAGAYATTVRVDSDAAQREGKIPAADEFQLTAKENERLLRIVTSTSRINRHYELFLLLQGEVQRFIPHQILISAWGDFCGSKLTFDVISAIPGVRTGQLADCSIEKLLNDLFAGWVGNGRRPMLLDGPAAESITGSDCNCSLHRAMAKMSSLLVHGVHDKRDEIESLYLAMNPGPMMQGPDAERFYYVVDSLMAQIDIAYRRVAALKSGAGSTASGECPRNPTKLSIREQEILKWVSEGKTNIKIAEILGISAFTVKNHAQRIFRKLGATNRTEAVARYRDSDSTA